MAEKKAGDFGRSDEGQTFKVGPADADDNNGIVGISNALGGDGGTGAQGVAGAQGAGPDKRLVLEISQEDSELDKKIKLRKKPGEVVLTGNPIIDGYNRLNDYLISSSKIKLKDKAVMYRLLAVMLNAGLPLIKSLRTLGFQTEKTPKLSKVLFSMATRIEGGKSLSEAMEEYSDIFSNAEKGVVKAGEASGQLNKTLKSLADEIEKNASITGKVKGAMIYPIVILTLLVGAIFLMMIMVVPQLTSLFDQAGQDLPLPTKILVLLSDISVNYWPYVILGIVVIGLAFNAWKKTRTGSYAVDWFKLNMPVFGPVFQKTVLSKFSRSFSNMMGSGVPIIKSIEIVSAAVGNEVYRKRLILTAEDMKRGIPMAENMSESKLFPKMLVNMIEVGEQTAQLESIMIKIADFYDDEVNNVVAALSKIMEPMILVFIGVTVGGLVAAVMLPIMQLTDVAGGM